MDRVQAEMKCTCLYYEPDLIAHENPTCPDHGFDAKHREEEARQQTRKKLREAGISEADMRDLGWRKVWQDRGGW